MEDIIEKCRINFKNKCRLYDRGLISFDELYGYIDAMMDIKAITSEESYHVVKLAVSNKVIKFGEEN